MKIKNLSKKFLWFVLGGLFVGFLSFTSLTEAQKSQVVKLLMRVGEERILEDGTKVSLSKGDGDLIAVTISKADEPKKVSFKKRFEVKASKMWVDTGIDVTDREIRIEYESGRWSNGGDRPIYSDGRGSGSWTGLLVSNAPFRSLVGKTSNGTFFVGNFYEGNPGQGRLYLSINDVPGSYNDNMGSLTVVVSSVD